MSKLAHVQAALNPTSEPDPLELLRQQVAALAQTQTESITKLARVMLSQFQGFSERISALENRKTPDLSSSIAALKTDMARIQRTVETIKLPELPAFPEIPAPRETDLSPVLSAIRSIKMPSIPESPAREYYMKVEYDQWGDVQGATFTPL